MKNLQRHFASFVPSTATFVLIIAASCFTAGCNSNDSADHHLTLADFGTGQESDTLFPRSNAEPPKVQKVAIAKPAPQETAPPKTVAKTSPVVKPSPQPAPQQSPKQPAPKQPVAEKKAVVQPEKSKPKTDSTVALAPKPKPAPADDKKAEKKADGGRPELPAGTGGFAGVVKFDGPAPAPKDIFAVGQATKDPAVCAATVAIPDQSLIVNQDNNGVKNVFVYMQKAPKGYKGKAPADALVFDQQNCVFFPHALIVQTGREVLVKNGDPIVHNTHTTPTRNSVFNSAIAPNDRKGVALTYRSPERLPVKVICDFHSWMSAYHSVLDHPCVAVTDEDGNFAVAGLPPGKHTFTIWQETPGYLERKLNVTVKAGEYTEMPLSYKAADFASFNGPQPKILTVFNDQ